ncbi:hypothetical protein [Burkholderia ubonensis]|uniref:hypothetical protein n=1 Tax=Burkholderia ubonensis TaxID=101571 RepID=UPI00075A6781|nr:hypothetical protein [Burkholderia ubonensis]KVP17248.1 hypothetical protein WJ84_03175 [Burkholderia ubonensis]KVP39629.1 hypothetical protein WJ87_05185 [Burkholderia ubonensis]
MQTMLFHKDVYAPVQLFQSPGALSLHYTRHALAAAHEDRYGDLTNHLIPKLFVASGEIVEVECAMTGRILKRVIRHQVTEHLDLVWVVMVDGVVKTVWGNLHDDHHKTLNRGRYVQPPRLH